MDKVVLITGGSRGIGKATAELFASQGYNVIINYKQSKLEAEELKIKLESTYSIRALAIQADISIEDEVKDMINMAKQTFGRIDILVNNAGISNDCNFSEKTASDFMKIYSTNLIGPFLVSKYCAPIMLDNKYGKIINISSNNTSVGFYPTTADYDASKSALESLTKNMAIEYAPYINVIAIAPGWVETDMAMQSFENDKDMIKMECNKILKRRFGKPEEIAKLIYFLASDDADYINGTTITIDGGYF